MNSKAAELTGHTPGTSSNRGDWVRYRPITPEAVRDALRLYEYGFDLPGNLIDGAYLRGIILNEIPHAGNGISKIVVGRPLTSRWLGDARVRSLTELRDMQTEVNFHERSYLGEKGHIELINQLISKDQPARDAAIRHRAYRLPGGRDGTASADGGNTFWNAGRRLQQRLPSHGRQGRSLPLIR